MTSTPMSWSTAAGEAVSALRPRFIRLPWHDYVGSRLPADGTQVSAKTPEGCPGQEGNTWATLYMLGKGRAEPGLEAGVAWTLPWIENTAGRLTEDRSQRSEQSARWKASGVTWTVREPVPRVASRLRRRRTGRTALQTWHREERGVSRGRGRGRAAAWSLPNATALDGELVVGDAAGGLAFERMQNGLARRGVRAARAAASRTSKPARSGWVAVVPEWPTHFGAFDLLGLSGTDTTGWPYRCVRHSAGGVCDGGGCM
ncbi:ATP-dependent DNA ligase [Streptomyces hygroscopicus subsp. limoneus]|nr:ATP-dependent DNA ligase [Streptomyces hygroscopicus subsp. limoneus]